MPRTFEKHAAKKSLSFKEENEKNDGMISPHLAYIRSYGTPVSIRFSDDMRRQKSTLHSLPSVKQTVKSRRSHLTGMAKDTRKRSAYALTISGSTLSVFSASCGMENANRITSVISLTGKTSVASNFMECSS